MNIGIYARVSTDKQETANQLDQLREFAARQGWTILVEYIDVVTGSGKKVRPKFEKMMLDASQKRFDLLLFWSMDRLSREGAQRTLTYLTNLDTWGVAWRSFTEPYFDSCGPFKDVVISVAATLAKQERLRISERTLAGLARAKREGKSLGRPEVRVDVVRVRKMQREGLGLRPIAAKLGCSVNTLQRALHAQ